MAADTACLTGARTGEDRTGPNGDEALLAFAAGRAGEPRPVRSRP